MLTLILSMPHCCNIVCKHSYPRLFRKSDNRVNVSVSSTTQEGNYKQQIQKKRTEANVLVLQLWLLLWSSHVSSPSQNYFNLSFFIPTRWHSKYAVLHFCFPTGEYVAQFKFTLLLMPNGPIRYNLKCFTLQLCQQPTNYVTILLL